ncbi:hypothetical protein BDD12DRAFT_808805 [Trichophaea hybrida]|nr:hypothetical protein BDD12DRAFT_808805 [Trichophaea hybrida]
MTTRQHDTSVTTVVGFVDENTCSGLSYLKSWRGFSCGGALTPSSHPRSKPPDRHTPPLPEQKTLLNSTELHKESLEASHPIDMPPPLPEQRTLLNSTELHKESLDALRCLDIPVGDLGLFIWLSSIVLVTTALYDSLCHKKMPSIRGNVITILASIASVFALYQDAQNFHNCSNTILSGPIRGATILAIIGSGFSTTGGILMIIAAYNISTHVANFAVALFSVALVFLFVAGPVYFISVAVSAGIFQGPTHWDRVSPEAVIVALLPWVGLQVSLAIVTFSCKIRDILKIKEQRRYVVCVLGQVVLLAFMFCAVGNVVLGKIVGDPWGLYVLKKWMGLTA